MHNPQGDQIKNYKKVTMGRCFLMLLAVIMLVCLAVGLPTLMTSCQMDSLQLVCPSYVQYYVSIAFLSVGGVAFVAFVVTSYIMCVC